MDISASLPAEYATFHAATEEDFLRWFGQIGELGANTVRATGIMSPAFYSALHEYNTTHGRPLYLLQGSSVDDRVGDGMEDVYAEEFMGALTQDLKSLVDIVHGRKNLPSVSTRAGGAYREDVSAWVVGYLIGTEWYADTISYTDHNTIRSGSYQGTYFETTPDASPFEAAMAQIMDEVTAYETDKYSVQRPIGFLSDPEIDFLEYEEVYARQLSKHAQVDPEHVKARPAMQGGCFAAYRLHDFCESFTQYLTYAQKRQFAPLLEGLDTTQPYGGYLQFLGRYHTMPIIAAGYGFSSGRGAVMIDRAPLTETEQGEQLVRLCQTLEQDGWAGGVITGWQDEWERRSWNAAFATVPTQGHMWHDLQTATQNNGLMAFRPGEQAVCTLDGSPDEWSEDDFVAERDGVRLSARYDAEGLYLLVEGVTADDLLYVPLDLSDEVGSDFCNTVPAPALLFARAADFLLCIDGRDNTRLLVHERYDALRERYLYETEGIDPFTQIPREDSGSFVPVRMATENPLLVDVINTETRAQRRLGTWETGRLVCAGAGDNSLADFCFGSGCVELRLPWLLLNVGDPSEMMVHRDYYDHYGVEFEQIDEIWFGLSGQDAAQAIEMHPFAVEGWNEVEYREELKKSYYIVQSYWNGGK